MASDLVNVQIPREDYQRIMLLAQQRGYASVDAYLLALVEDDVEDDEIDPVESFGQGWHEVITGQTRPIEAVWELLRKHGDDSEEHQD